MLRFILLLCLCFALTEAKGVDKNDPRIIDLSQKNVALRKSGPKPKEKSVTARRIRARMTKTRQKLEKNAEIERMKLKKMKMTAQRGLDFIERILVKSHTIKLNDEKKIVKIDPPQVKNVRNLLTSRIGYNLDQKEENKCGKIIEITMRAGALSKKLRDNRLKRQNQQKGMEIFMIIVPVFSF